MIRNLDLLRKCSSARHEREDNKGQDLFHDSGSLSAIHSKDLAPSRKLVRSFIVL